MSSESRYPEYLYKDVFADLFLAMLRAARSPHEEQYRRNAEFELASWLRIWGEKQDESTLRGVIDCAVEKVGFQKEPECNLEKELQGIARAGITYLIEAGAPSFRQGLLTRRRDELMRAIEGHMEARQYRRSRNQASTEG